ncbi:hypothetical protein N7520_010055 [Penicillium odoratum]|uniref:uncharacterized protein n=1 Tax=Penicillium odoratum TaxID=1167516 RepID=UPI0025473C78|nr:uncharacterized protein N7520_010055 [Penicillium odoratum]KAJ5753138.1 hypothetical protein N7520_010055 [Penicillium odoratum]
MVHGRAHHTHDHPEVRLGERGHNNDAVIVYTTLEKTFEGEVGGYVTGDQNDNADTKTASEKTKTANVGVGPAVAATRTTEETKTTEEAKKTSEEAKTTTTEDKTTTEESQKQTAKETTTEEAEKAKTTTQAITEATTTRDTQAITTATDEARSGATRTSFVTSTSTASTSTTSTSTDSTQDVNALSHVATDSASSSNAAASASSTAISSGSAGMSSGAKAGVAIGVLLGVGLIAALIFFIFRKKRRSQADEPPPMDEKIFSAQDLAPFPVPKPMAPSKAPQLNVRPVTQFAPDLSNSASFATASTVAAGTWGAAAAPRNLTGDVPSPTPPKSAGSGSSQNPFKDPVNPFNTGSAPSSDQSLTPTSSPDSTGPAFATPAAGAAAVGAIGAAAFASHESDKENFTRPRSMESDVRPPSSPSPVSVDDGESISSAAMIAGGVPGGAGPGPLNVYRVQLDFIPSAEDELSLLAGNLVRMLHEYDDGWALCVRLDRSQQGVVPRSHLSARPVKPRPRPPPGAPGPGFRGPPAMGPNGRPMAPGGRGPPSGRFYPTDARPRSPGRYGGPPRPYPGRSMSPVQFPVPRSMMPGQRSMSPGPGMRPGTRAMSPGPRSMSPGLYGGGPRSMSPAPGPDHYGGPGMHRPGIPINQRQRSNSAGNMPPNVAAMDPPRSSPLVTQPLAPAPTGDLPAVPNSAPSSPGSEISKKPVPTDF